MAANCPYVTVDQYHIDILTANFVRIPEHFDVVVGSNLFGDILSDLGPACTGTIAIAPSANINPEGKFPSMFEPVHGSAPGIAGQGIANPIGTIWAGAMMMQHLDCPDTHDTILQAIEAVLADGNCQTGDMWGTRPAPPTLGRRLPQWSPVDPFGFVNAPISSLISKQFPFVNDHQRQNAIDSYKRDKAGK